MLLSSGWYRSNDAFALEDLVPPTAGITQPLTGSVLQAGPVVVKGTAQDDASGSGIQKVEVRYDKKSYLVATPKSAGDWSTWSVTLNIPTADLHNITARATDNAGNRDWFDIKITTTTHPLDITKPKLTITTPSTGYLSIGNSIAVEGTAFDNVGGSGIKQVEVRIDKKSYLVATPKSAGDWSKWSITLSTSILGSHIISARTVDNAGNGVWNDVSITTSMTDKFGVTALYPHKPGGEEWFVNMNAPISDLRFDPGATITKNEDGSWKIKSSKVRLEVMTTSGYHPENIDTYDQDNLADNGYMQDQRDWKNIEITGFVKINSATSTEDNIAWYARGGKHNDAEECEGTSYKGRLFYSGLTGFSKEQWHDGGYSFTTSKSVTSSIMDRWVGFKVIMYNMPADSDNTSGVVLENWLNNNADKKTWVKVDTKTDDGSWGNQGGVCGGSPDQILTWGGPLAYFRWDSSTDADFKWLSVREIEPPV